MTTDPIRAPQLDQPEAEPIAPLPTAPMTALEREELLADIKNLQREKREIQARLDDLLDSETEVILTAQAYFHNFSVSPSERRVRFLEFGNAPLAFSNGNYTATLENMQSLELAPATRHHPLAQAPTDECRFVLVHENGRFVLISRLDTHAWRMQYIQTGRPIKTVRMEYDPATKQPSYMALQASKDYIHEFVSLVRAALPERSSFYGN